MKWKETIEQRTPQIKLGSKIYTNKSKLREYRDTRKIKNLNPEKTPEKRYINRA